MIPNMMNTIYSITKKEMLEHFKTKRLLILTIIFMILFFIIAIWGGYLMGSADPDEPIYESGANNVLLATLAFTGILFPGVLAIALSYDTIVGERTRRSLHLIISKPIDRSAIFIGKFLAAFLSIVIVYAIVGTIGYGLVIGISGNIPSLEEVGRAYAAIGLVLFSAACWVLFTMLFSTSFKTVISTILVAILFWFIILPLIAVSGQIYFLVSSVDDTPEPITVDFSTQVDPRIDDIESTILTFQAHRYGTPILGVEFDVRYENGTKVEQLEMGGGSILSLIPTYTIGPGKYTWTAHYDEDDDKELEKIASGSFKINDNFLPSVYLSNSEGDQYNDFLFLIGNTNGNIPRAFNITLLSLDDNQIVEQELKYSDNIFIVKDLNEGDYRITVEEDGYNFLNTTFHSYGDSEPRGGMFIINDEEVEYPDYVKFTTALSPDYSASVYTQVLTGETTGAEVLTVQEGIIALTVEFVILFSVGLLIFSRIDLS